MMLSAWWKVYIYIIILSHTVIYSFYIHEFTWVGPFLSWFRYHTVQKNTVQNLTLKIQGLSHGSVQMSISYSTSNILSIHTPFVQCQSNHTFLKCSYLMSLPWKYKVRVMSGVKSQCHIVDPHRINSYPCCVHVNWIIYSWDLAWHPEEHKTWYPKSSRKNVPQISNFGI